MDLRETLEADFRPFLFMCFKTMKIEPHEIQYEAADWLQHAPDRRVFSCMREFGKTITIASYICWRLYQDSNYMMVVQCANADKAESIVGLVKDLLKETPLLQYLAPQKSMGDIDRANRFNVRTKTSVARENSVTAYGSLTEITGTHVHEVIADDLETRENCLTDLRRERLLELIHEYEDLLISDLPCRVTIIGTPQTQASVYFTLADNGYEMMRIPSRYPALNNPHINTLAPFLLRKLLDPKDLAADYWGPTYPERKPEEYLVKKQMLVGDPRFYLQDLLDPSLTDADLYPLKLSHLIVYDSDVSHFPTSLYWSNQDKDKLHIASPGFAGDYFYGPAKISDNYIPFTERILWVDPSGSGEDEVSWTVGLGVPGYIYIPEVSASVDGFSEITYKRIAMAAKKWHVHRVIVESNFGGGAYRRLLEPMFRDLGVNANLEDRSVRGNKEARIIDTLRPFTAGHKIVISTEVAKDAIWGYQYSNITYTPGCLPHDDRIDSFWGVVNELSNNLEQDEVNFEESKLERLREALKDYMKEDLPTVVGPLGRYDLDTLGSK